MRQKVRNPADYFRNELNTLKSMAIEIQKIWLRDHQRDLHFIVRDTHMPTDDCEYVCALAPSFYIRDHFNRNTNPQTHRHIELTQQHAKRTC